MHLDCQLSSFFIIKFTRPFVSEFISEKVASEVKVEKENSTSSANYVQGFFNFDIVDDTPKIKVEVSKENRSSELMEKIEEEKHSNL